MPWRVSTITRQRSAQTEVVNAAQRSYDISEARYKEGINSFLESLIAQRTLYSAQQSAVSLVLSDLSNRISLYEALGADTSL